LGISRAPLKCRRTRRRARASTSERARPVPFQIRFAAAAPSWLGRRRGPAAAGERCRLRYARRCQAALLAPDQEAPAALISGGTEGRSPAPRAARAAATHSRCARTCEDCIACRMIRVEHGSA
jgi:hypothetical protein